MKKSIAKACLTGVFLSFLLNTTVQASSGTVTGDRVNVRISPSTTSMVLVQKNSGEKVTILSKEGDWYKILLGNNRTAFMSSTYIKEEVAVTTVSTTAVTEEIITLIDSVVNTTSDLNTNETPSSTEEITTPDVTDPNVSDPVAQVKVVTKMGLVTADILNLRSTPSLTTSTNIIAKLNANEKVTILKTEGDWYYISTSSKQEGYAFKDYVQISESATASGTTDIRTKMIDYAKQFLGNPYVYGGTSLTKGTDCSGFTMQIYKKFGYTLNRSSYTQRKNGTAISTAELKPGDLVFYGYAKAISHVAMYIGNGKIIHASTSSTGIIISNLYGSMPLIGCNRILQ